MTKEERIEQTEKALVHTYIRFPRIFERGQGVRLYDTEGKEYLDFASGIGVMGLGYGNEKLNEVLKNQVTLLTHVSNLFYTVPCAEAAEKVLKKSGMDRVFFTNSGAEAVEGALKAARKYYYTKTGETGGEIIAMEESFHGRTMGALSVTGKEAYRKPFEPLIGGVHFAKYNDLDSVKALVNDKTCAIILETVQGEGGIFPAEKDFLKGIRELCDEKDILLILDEIQCGMGRTGDMFAWQTLGVRPDIMTVAKALGCGVPVGAFLMTENVAQKSLSPGDHGTTYGGNPFVTSAVAAVQDIYEEEGILDHVKEITPVLTETLDKIKDKFDFITAHRGLGLIRGLEFASSPASVVSAAHEEGLIVISAGHNVIRFLPPLIITKEDVKEMEEKFTRALASYSA